MAKPPRATLPVALLLALLLGGCERGKALNEVFPQDIPHGAVCSVDGMVLAQHPGPKGQWVEPDGKAIYFCDLKEVLAALHEPERSKRGRWFVQAFDGLGWGSHAGSWVAAEEALFVLDSKAEGTMGPTPVPFRKQAAAEAFAAAQGGRIVAYGGLTGPVVEHYLAAVRERFRGMGGMGQGSTPPERGKTMHPTHLPGPQVR